MTALCHPSRTLRRSRLTNAHICRSSVVPDERVPRRLGRVEAQREELAEHQAAAFPASINRGEVYGEVEPVLIDADIMGWLTHDRLDSVQRRSLRQAADELAGSLPTFPADARPYFERLLRLARRAVAAG